MDEAVVDWLLQGAITSGESQATSTGVNGGGKNDYSKEVPGRDDVLQVKITHS